MAGILQTAIKIAAVLAVAIGLVQAVRAQISGHASVIDGNTIEVDGRRMSLYGIDAPEARQICHFRAEPYPCGQRAAFMLAKRIGTQPVRCTEQGLDRRGRTLATCFVGEVDLGAWMVSRGWALADRRSSFDYIDEGNEALRRQRGLWRGDFMRPWEWRRSRRLDR